MNVSAPVTEDFAAAWEAFSRAQRRARARVNTRLEGSVLTLAQFQLLEGLQTESEMTVSELAVSAGVAPPTATRMLDALVKAGIAERHASPHDRRVVLVSLTPEGRASVQAAAERVERWRTALRGRLTTEEQAQAAKLLRRLADVIEDL